MENLKQKIVEILSNFENANLSSEAAKEIIADKLLKIVKDKFPPDIGDVHKYYDEDEYKDEQQKLGEALRQQIKEDERS